jgi:hypothetical protein
VQLRCNSWEESSAIVFIGHAGIKRLVALRNSFIARNIELLVDVVSADWKSGP